MTRILGQNKTKSWSYRPLFKVPGAVTFHLGIKKQLYHKENCVHVCIISGTGGTEGS